MKKGFLLLLSLVVVMTVTTVSVSAQEKPQIQHLPLDPALRMGTLPNGMKYYIYKNEKPKGLADFYIVHNVGAIQEADNQNGLAHFLEHMAFNGTKNLPGKKMLEYFQANGVEFGRDVNAQTGMDETQYMIMNVPMTREGILDTAIMAIADWSGGVALLDEEIDNERGVILEEKRTGNSSGRRMMEKYLPTLYNGSKYAERNVIGTEEILNNFKYQELKDFYHQWYRPDLQAVIVVGDIDVDKIEAKIKNVMGAIPAHSNPTPKESYMITPYEKDFVQIVTDKEARSSSAMVIASVEKLPEELNDTPQVMFKDLISSVVSSIMSERYSEISKQADAPFLGASMGVEGLSPWNEIVSVQVSTKDGGLAKGLEVAMTEVTRLLKYGVTTDEVDRVKSNLMKSVQTSYDNRADRRNDGIAQSLISRYTNNTPVLTPEMEYKFYKSAVEQLSVPLINQIIPKIFVQLPSAIITMSPEKEGAIPTEEVILAAYNKGKNATVEAPKEEKIDRPLVEKEPKAVKIAKESKDIFGNTVWTLKNGAKIVIKKTDFVADQIIFSATGMGGNNMVADNKVLSSSMLPNMLNLSGLGTFTANELSKVLAGKSAGVSKSVSDYSHGISGSSTKSDIKTMFQLLYLSYTAQPFLQKDFDLLMSKLNSSLENMESQPSYIFQGKTQKVFYGDNERVKQLSKSNIGQIKFEEIKATHDMLFDGVDGMTFVFAGSINEAELKPLVEQYIASLPKGAAKNDKNTSVQLVKGKVSETFPIVLTSPKVSYNAMFYTDDIKDMSIKNMVVASMLNDVLQVKYTKSIREEMGATYGVGNDVSASYKPTTRYTISVMFDTNEEKLAAAGVQVKKEIEAIANGASLKEEIEISRGAMIKNYEKSIATSNNVWVNYIHNFYKYGNNYPKDYLPAVKSVTEKDIQDMAKKILESGNEIELIMVPAK